MPGTVYTHTQITAQVCGKVFGIPLLCFIAKASTDFEELQRKLSSSGNGDRRLGKRPVTLMPSIQVLNGLFTSLITDMVAGNTAKQCSNILIPTVIEIHYKIKLS